MRHKAETEQVTRLLLHKPAAYAELEENARIAITVLQDDGWAIERVGLEMEVRITTTPVSGVEAMEQAHKAHVESALLALKRSEELYMALRQRVREQVANAWLAGAGAAFATGICVLLHLNLIAVIGGWICAGIGFWLRRRAKGAA